MGLFNFAVRFGTFGEQERFIKSSAKKYLDTANIQLKNIHQTYIFFFLIKRY